MFSNRPVIPWTRNDMSYSVLIVDEHPILRRGIASVIESDPRLVLVGEVGDGRAAVPEYARLRPDVVLIDLAAGESADVQGIAAICALDPKAKVIKLASGDSGDSIHDVLHAGARGYLRIDATIDELLTCILQVAEGGKYLAVSAMSKLADSLWFDALSRRELDILKLVSTGKTNRDIGHAAGIAEETVKSHVNSILSKLGVASRTEAVSVAVRSGVIRFA